MSKSGKVSWEQKRALFAHKRVSSLLEFATDEGAKRYKAYVRRFPMYIHKNGLAASFYFALNKAGSKTTAEYGDLLEHIREWIATHPLYNNWVDTASNKKMVSDLVELTTEQYRALTLEVFAILSWLKRVSEGLIEGESTETQSN